MARRVYFSFHYQDVTDFRANVVRNSSVFRSKRDAFHDASIWEEAEEKKVKSLKRLIDQELKGCSVTCVLIGEETFSRRWVRYEIIKSFIEGKGQLGIGINWIKDRNGSIKFWPGENPFEYLKVKVSKDGSEIEFLEKKNDDWISYSDLPRTINRFFDQNQFGDSFKLSSFYDIYSYSWDNGSEHLQEWIEKAAERVGR